MTKPRLLVVEDDEAIRLQLKYALRDGFELAFAEDCPGALKALAEHRPPVVTLDLGLPPSPDTKYRITNRTGPRTPSSVRPRIHSAHMFMSRCSSP